MSAKNQRTYECAPSATMHRTLDAAATRPDTTVADVRKITDVQRVLTSLYKDDWISQEMVGVNTQCGVIKSDLRERGKCKEVAMLMWCTWTNGTTRIHKE